ncbi:hypothetical protein GCM10010327_47860 [Streptomyces nitrosporeus]|nr:hypothetical protein GCM10010327_47860 [Streptomyces nitrosporeus]
MAPPPLGFPLRRPGSPLPLPPGPSGPSGAPSRAPEHPPPPPPGAPSPHPEGTDTPDRPTRQDPARHPFGRTPEAAPEGMTDLQESGGTRGGTAPPASRATVFSPTDHTPDANLISYLR